MGANTGIGLSAQQYYYYGAGLEDLVTAQGVSWTPNFTGNATITIPETQQAPTGQAVQRSPAQSVPLSSATDVTPPITAIGNGSFEGQIQRWNNGERNYQLILRSRTMPTSLVIVDELRDGSTNGTLTNFPAAQPWVPVLGTNQAYLGNRNDVSFTDGISTTLNIVSSWDQQQGVFGSWVSNRPAVGSLLSSGVVTVQVIGHPPGNHDVSYSVASGTDPEIQAAFEYPNVFNIQPFDSATQAYAGNFTTGNWRRGVHDNGSGVDYRLDRALGSPSGSYPSVTVGTVFTSSEGNSVSVTDISSPNQYRVNIGTTTREEFQQGFQWPNHFTVTPPP